MSKCRSYTASFKLTATERAEVIGKRAAAREFEIDKMYPVVEI